MTDLARWEHAGREPAVVLLHEGGGSLRSWVEASRGLVSRRRAIVYDRRGFGASPHVADFGPRHFDQAVRDLLELVRARCREPVDLVGHSDGGTVALLAAACDPAWVRSVTVVATHIRADPATVRAVEAFGFPTAWDDRLQVRYELHHGADWADVVGRWMTMWTSRSGLLDWDMSADLSAVRCPVLVVHDRADALSPALHAEEIAMAVPTAAVSWYETGSHWPHVRERGRFEREVQDFWSSVA